MANLTLTLKADKMAKKLSQKWYSLTESNRRPLPCQVNTLTKTELSEHLKAPKMKLLLINGPEIISYSQSYIRAYQGATLTFGGFLASLLLILNLAFACNVGFLNTLQSLGQRLNPEVNGGLKNDRFKMGVHISSGSGRY